MDWTGVRAMVFDMDGTLLNTERVIVQSASQALQALGYGPLPEAYCMPNMFGTAAELMLDVLLERGLPLPVDGSGQLGSLFERCYAQQPADAAPMYDGVLEWLLRVKQAGIKLGVCTNKQQALALAGLDAAGLLSLFEVVTGRDTYGMAKPAAEPLLGTLQALQVAPHESVFFGDTHADAACAQAADVRFAWFSHGFGTELVHRYPQMLAFSDYRQLPLPGAAPSLVG